MLAPSNAPADDIGLDASYSAGHDPAAMLSLRNVRKAFGPVVAVDDLSLDVRRGEVFGLLGPNGAGKTTAINIALGQLRPDAGVVELDGAGSPADPGVRQRIGNAPQSLALYEELTAEENLRFFGKLYGLAGAALKQRVEQLLEMAGLRDRRRDRVKTYSGGMKRRLNLAVALVHDPPLLLLDESTVGVDPQSRNAIFELVASLHADGRTIVYTTHYMEEAERLCDRVAIIDHGRMLAMDTVDALLDRYGGKRVVIAEGIEGEVRLDTDNPVAELARWQAEGRLRGFRVERPNLEAVFLRLTGRRLRD
jgi:ABC-2 type transport system ATP-binding protein